MEFYSSPLEKLYQWESQRPNAVFLEQPANNHLYTWTWAEAANEVRRMAAAIRAMEFEPCSKIALLSKNCAHWIMADLAIMMSGHTSVPLYPNQNAESLAELLEHSESCLLFVGKLDKWDELKSGIPSKMPCISFSLYGPGEEGQLHWEDLIDTYKPIEENVVRDPEDTITLIYTSGTTGGPKGVLQPFRNFSFVAENAIKLLGFNTKDRFFCYLQLCHIAERMIVEMAGIYSGGSVSFAQSIETFREDMIRAKPTSFLGVPRIWAKFQEGILSQMSQRKLDLLLNVPILNSVIRKKIKGKLGLENAHSLFVGAAPMPISLLNWYEKLGMSIREAYAMTENCCYSHVTMADKIKKGYVGKAMPQVEVRLGLIEDIFLNDEQNGDHIKEGEILIRHPALMTGYFKEHKATANAFTSDGFLKTGDTGSMDKEGFLKISGRVKARFKTAKGKYIVPEPIEDQLKSSPIISEACVLGPGIRQPIGLVTLNEMAANKDDDEISEQLRRTLVRVNSDLVDYTQILTVVIFPGEWTVENGYLTPTMKVKRPLIEKKFKRQYLQWGEETVDVIFYDRAEMQA